MSHRKFLFKLFCYQIIQHNIIILPTRTRIMKITNEYSVMIHVNNEMMLLSNIYGQIFAILLIRELLILFLIRRKLTPANKISSAHVLA